MGESEPTKRAEITGTAVIETRQFSSRNRYLPIPQTSMDKNPNLKQKSGVLVSYEMLEVKRGGRPRGSPLF